MKPDVACCTETFINLCRTNEAIGEKTSDCGKIVDFSCRENKMAEFTTVKLNKEETIDLKIVGMITKVANLLCFSG